MALEITKQTIEVEVLIGAQYTQVLIRAETLVPGAGREAIEPMLSEADVSVSGVDVQTDRLVLDGTVYCQGVYRQGEENSLRALTVETGLSRVVEMPGALPGMIGRVLAQVEHVEARYENGHMVFQVTCGLQAQALRLEEVALIDGISGVDGLEANYGDVCSCKPAADTESQVLVKGEISLPVVLDARTSLMDWGTTEVESIQPDLGGIKVKGRIQIETLIASGVTGRPAALIKYPLEFDQLVELPEWLMKGASARASVRRIRSSVHHGQEGEDSALHVDAELTLSVQSDGQDCVSALRDAYTTEGRSLKVELEEFDICSRIERLQFSESVRGTVLLGESVPGVGTVIAVRVRPNVAERVNENGKGRIGGLLEAEILYMPSGSDIPASTQAELPFSVEIPGEFNDESLILLEAMSAEANALMSDRLEMKVMLSVQCETRRRERMEAVLEVEEGEAVEKRPGIVILWPEEGQTAWDICKHYSLPSEAVEGKIEPGKPVVLKI